VGYGKSQEHERLSMNFGPLNQDAGWRRLNVLVTRARERCVVFSSIRAEDFDLTATQARGVQALRDYLEYALTGRLTDVGAGDDESGSDFERAVYNALSDRGLTLRRQVGCAGYAIDLAVIDPKTPGRYLLGIECDGATYRGLASARDRDRLRQQVLEGLGWRMHRIWATDWFRQPQREIDRALDAVRRAASGNWQPMLRDEAPSPASPETPGGGPAKAAPLAQPYRSYHSAGVRTAEDFYAGSLAHIAQVLAKVVECEGPIRLDLALRRAAAVWGLTRMGPKIQDRATQALDVCQQKGTVLLRDGFLWPAGMTIAPVRCRDADELRDIDLVCLDEIGQAACAVLRSQMGMSRQDLVLQTARLLGFASAGSRVAARIEDAIQDKLGSGEIQTDPSGSLRAP
jgi:very-short-patch-repair endonuclease